MKSILRILSLLAIVLVGILAVVFIPGTHTDGDLTVLGYALTGAFGGLLLTQVKPAKQKQ